MNKAIPAIVLLLIANLCQADSVIEVVEKEGSTSKARHFYIADEKISFVDAQSSMIFDTKSGQMTVLDHKEKTYLTISAAQMQQVSDQAGQMMQQMHAQMATRLQSLPPEQRAQMEQMMAQMGHASATSGTMPGKSLDEMLVRPTGRSEIVKGIHCKVIEVYQAGTKVAENCLAPYSRLGISDSDYRTLKQFIDYQNDLAERFDGGKDKDFMQYGMEQNMLPVKVITFKDGRNVSTSSVSASAKTVSAQAFVIPGNYKAETIEYPGQ